MQTLDENWQHVKDTIVSNFCTKFPLINKITTDLRTIGQILSRYNTISEIYTENAKYNNPQYSSYYNTLFPTLSCCYTFLTFLKTNSVCKLHDENNIFIEQTDIDYLSANLNATEKQTLNEDIKNYVSFISEFTKNEIQNPAILNKVSYDNLWNTQGPTEYSINFGKTLSNYLRIILETDILTMKLNAKYLCIS